MSFPVAASQMLAVLSSDAVAMSRPVGAEGGGPRGAAVPAAGP